MITFFLYIKKSSITPLAISLGKLIVLLHKLLYTEHYALCFINFTISLYSEKLATVYSDFSFLTVVNIFFS